MHVDIKAMLITIKIDVTAKPCPTVQRQWNHFRLSNFWSLNDYKFKASKPSKTINRPFYVYLALRSHRNIAHPNLALIVPVDVLEPTGARQPTGTTLTEILDIFYF